MNYENAMNWEEAEVDRIASDQFGLNMIPGGFKGLKFLHKRRLIKSMDITLEERENAIADYIREHPRKGIPNPFLSQLWEDDDFYLRINEANPKRLSEQQVEKILDLHKMGWSIPQITIEVGALNEKQVNGVITEKNYGRTIARIQKRNAKT